MNIRFITILFIALILPLSSNAQGIKFNSTYIVAEAGVTKNSLALSGPFSALQSNDKSGASFGATIGYRTLLSSNFVVGLEGSLASSSGSTSVSDGFDTLSFDSNLLYGAYLTAGFAFGEMNQALLYALLGVGGTNADVAVAGVFTGNNSISDNGSGISFGGAFEYGITETLGVRVKALHTQYRGDIEGLRVRDTSVMGGVVFSF